MILGLDLSLTSTGVATVYPATPAAVLDTITSRPAGGEWHHRHDRIARLAGTIVNLARPGLLVVVEAPAYSRTTGAQHDRAGLWWLVVHGLYRKGCHVALVPPTTRAKYATGKGNAGKDAVLAAVVRRYGWADVAGNDTADALVLAAMGARWAGTPVDDPLPISHLAAMDGGQWPSML